MKKVQERNVIRNYDRAFLKTMGTLEKPMRRQNIQPFLMELLPRYIIREVHVEEFLSSVTDDVDGLVTWEQLSAWLSAEATHEAGDEAPQTR